ncbi:hypothetical protein [Altericroceibacterium endophyticum]|uniref:Uncharacterized protein n=1 Tax=Altericroceibacterium endophyticum TaxID=1808508 RepID=A0A6I4T547_9SPHN|nr:hypothetical protein [Altericroceibacterium endophyticum]MXO65987.1 hypothetical protein [Altericroceibacterium endophyticum]
MRVALMSLVRSVDDSASAPLGALRLIGRSLAQRQLDFALALGCDTVLCSAEALSEESRILQRSAEERGIRFRLVRGAPDLIGSVSAGDQLLILADGLLSESSEARDLIKDRAVILTLPANIGVPSGFERIDAQNAWAGAALLPAALVEKLAHLPDDVDPIAALLRLALQARVPLRELSERPMREDRWRMIDGHADLEAIEPDWLERQIPSGDRFAPSEWIAGRVLRKFGSQALARNLPLSAVYGAASGLLLLSLLASYIGWSSIAFLLLALAALSSELAAMLAIVMRSAFGRPERGREWLRLFPVLRDASLALVIYGALPGEWGIRLFPALMLTALVALVPPTGRSEWNKMIGSLARDRFLLALILSAMTLFGVVELGVRLCAFILVASMLVSQAERD